MYDKSARNQCLLLLPRRHSFHFVTQLPPVVRLQFGILYTLLAPVLVQPTDMVLALLEVDELIPDALLDEHTPCMLLHN